MNLYVGNLSYQLHEDQLTKAFEEYGEVKSVRIITDRETGRPRGFGFVEMVDKEGGQAAIDGLNNAELDGRKLVVNEARPKPQRNRW
jgi:RNA recognition motif-containing protein